MPRVAVQPHGRGIAHPLAWQGERRALYTRASVVAATDDRAVARQVYRIRRARVARRTTGGQVIAPGDYYGEVAVRIFQRGGPVIQRRRVVYAMPATGVAAWLKAGSPRRVDGMQFTRFTR